MKKVFFRILIFLITAGIIGVFGLKWFISNRMKQIPNMTTEEVLEFTLKDNEEAIITVGIIDGENMDFVVYGNNGEILSQKEHEYEIGSITKTFTTSLLSKGIENQKYDLDDPINKYLPLSQDKKFPSLKNLVTHTSGLKSYYFNFEMGKNMISGINALSGLSRESIYKQLENNSKGNEIHPFLYSNLGIATIGEVMGINESSTYTKLMTDFIKNDLDLQHTKISDGTGDLNNYWLWNENDYYIPAGAIISTIGDMMKYTKLHINEEISYLADTHKKLVDVKNNSEDYEVAGIIIDGVGLGWMIDERNNIIWHNGGTSNFNSYLGFDKDKQLGVVILSNISPNSRIPATIYGVKLLKDLQNSK